MNDVNLGEIKENEKIFNDKIDDLSNKIKNLNDVNFEEIKEVSEYNKNLQLSFNNFVFNFSKQIEDINGELENLKNSSNNSLINDEKVHEKVEKEENIYDKEFILNNIKELNKNIDVEQELLNKDIEVEGEILNKFINSQGQDFEKLLEPIGESIFRRKETIKFLNEQVNNNLSKLDLIDNNLVNEKEQLTLLVKEEIENTNNITQKIKEIFEDYSINKDKIEEKVKQNFEFINFFYNIELTKDNSKSLELLIKEINKIKNNFEIESILISNSIDNNKLIKENIDEITNLDLKEIVEINSNSSVLKELNNNLEDSLKKLNKYVINSEKYYEGILKYGNELEKLYNKSNNDNENLKLTEEKIDENLKLTEEKIDENLKLTEEKIDENLKITEEKIDSKILTEEYILNLKNEVKKEILTSLKEENLKLDRKTLPVFIMNSKKNIMENFDFDVKKLKWCKYTDTEIINYSKNIEYKFNSIDNFSNKVDIKKIYINDWVSSNLNSKSIVGKVFSNKYSYNNIEIKGNQLGPVVLFYNDQEPVTFQNEIGNPTIFDNIEILSIEEVKIIIKEQYGIDKFNIELCYYCSPSLTFLIPSYHIKFIENEKIDLYFPANLNFLPKLVLNEINVKSYTMENLKRKNLENMDMDDMGNKFQEEREFQVFNVELKDILLSGDKLNVFSDFEIKLNDHYNFDIYIPTVLKSEILNNLNQIEISIICQNNFGFENILKFELNLSKYKNLFKVNDNFNHGGNRHNFGINNFDNISGHEVYNKFRNSMKSSGILEEYLCNKPNYINGNADLIVNVAGGDKINSLIFNNNEEFLDVEHMINLTSTNIDNNENLINFLNKKVHLFCSFKNNISKSNILQDFYRNSYKNEKAIVSSWLISTISNGLLNSNPFIIGPLLSDVRNKNSIESSIKNNYRGYINDSVWGTNPGPGLDTNKEVTGFWELIII